MFFKGKDVAIFKTKLVVYPDLKFDNPDIVHNIQASMKKCD